MILIPQLATERRQPALDSRSGPAGELLSTARKKQLLLGFVLLGLAARCLRFLLKFPLWEDECFLCVNFIDRSYAGLLEPLQYHQVAPPLFLWIELTIVRLLGFHEWSLRLFPFLCNVASLWLFYRLAKKLLHGLPLVFAAATFSLAYPCLRYAAEAKQYATDQFVALVLLTLFVQWLQSRRTTAATELMEATPRRSLWLWAAAGFTPIAIWLSYPAIFVVLALSLASCYVLRLRDWRRAWLPWIALNALLVTSFGLLWATIVHVQSSAELNFMDQFWQRAFPPWDQPWQLPGWLLLTHASELLAYPIGGENGGSTLTLLACAAGVVVLARRRRGTLLMIALAPFAFQLAAAALHRYPYGGHVKFTMHLAPAICWLAGMGTAAWLNLLTKRPHVQRAMLIACLLFPLLVGAGSIVRDIWRPFKSLSDERARSFARWFWFNAEFAGEAVCLKTDLGLDFAPRTFRELSWSAMYLCNRRIYSPRHQVGAAPGWQRIAADWPLRCLLYRDPQFLVNEGALERWLSEMAAQYQLVSRDRYPFPRYDERERRLVRIDHVEIFTFIPVACSPPTGGVE
jgi:hypothetical protein